MNGSALVSINILIEACYIDSIELYLAIKKYKNIFCRIIDVTKNNHIKQNKSYSNIVYFPLTMFLYFTQVYKVTHVYVIKKK